MHCRICGNERDNRVYEAREMMYGDGDVFRYFQCSGCGCLQIEEVPSDLSTYYRGDYYSYEKIRNPNGVKRRLIDLRDKYCVWGRGWPGHVLSWVYPTSVFQFLRHVPVRIDMGILDVGCGAGRTLFALRELGFENLLGVDPFLSGDIEYENGLTIRKQCIDEVTGTWDVIVFHHSFEHIADPHGTLRSVHRLLGPGGICVIRIPTVSSYAWEHYGVNWVQLDAPRHLYLHSVESMAVISRQTGFELHRWVCDSTAFQFWGSEQYLRGIPLRHDRSHAVNPQVSAFSRRQIRDFERRAAHLNAAGRGDQAVFYLHRAESSTGWQMGENPHC